MRHKDTEWSLPETVQTCEQAGVAVLMDIRDELRLIRSVLCCPNARDIPNILRDIRTNTKKPRRRKARGASK